MHRKNNSVNYYKICKFTANSNNCWLKLYFPSHCFSEPFIENKIFICIVSESFKRWKQTSVFLWNYPENSTECYTQSETPEYRLSGRTHHFSLTPSLLSDYNVCDTVCLSGTGSKWCLLDGPKNRGHYAWLLIPSKCLNQFAWLLAHFKAVLFWTHVLTLTLSNKVAPPGKNPATPILLSTTAMGYSARNSAEPVCTGCMLSKSTAATEYLSNDGKTSTVCLNSRKLLTGDMTCSEAWQKVLQETGISEWCHGDVISIMFCSRTADTSNIFQWKNDAVR